MNKKLIAVLAVLLMIATPLIAFECSDTSEAEANESSIKYLDDITDQTVDCWVKGTSDKEKGIITLTPDLTSADRSVVVLAVKDSGEYKNVDAVITDALTVPQGAALICTAVNESYSKEPRFSVTNNLTVNGTIAGYIYTDNKDVKITLDGANVNAYYDGFEESCDTEIKMNDTATLTIKNTTFEEFYDGTKSKITFCPGSTLTMDDTTIGCNLTFCRSVNNIHLLRMNDVEANGFKLLLNPGSGEDVCTLSGSLVGTSWAPSSIVFYEKSMCNATLSFVWDKLYMSDLTIHFGDIYSTNFVIIKNDTSTILDYSDITFEDTEDMTIFDKMRSGDKDTKMLLFAYSPIESKDVRKNISVIIDESVSEVCFNVVTVSTQGIANIDESHRINFVKVGESVNLDEITVTCKSGYKFAGWYYADENGILCPISNPQEFVVTESMKVYAVAEKEDPVIPDPPTPVYPESKDYTVWFVVLVIMAALLMVMVAFTHYAARQNALKAAPAAKRTSTRKTRTKKK